MPQLRKMEAMHIDAQWLNKGEKMKILHPLLSVWAHCFIVYLLLLVSWDQEVMPPTAAEQEQCPFRTIKLFLV